jgi:APA family basic amino acid/polyamine antiporter
MLMIGPRVLEAMSGDGYLPRSLSTLNRRRVPSHSVACLAVLAALIAITSSFGPLLVYIGYTLNMFAALTVIAVFKLRMRGECKHRICIGYPVTPLIFIAFALWTSIWAIQSQPLAFLAGAATLAVGMGAYALRMTTFYNLGESRR